MRNLIGVAGALSATLYFATPIPASAGSANQGPGWGAVAGAGILGALLGAAAVPQPQPQIIVIVPQQPSYVAPQPVPGISVRQFLEHYVPDPTPQPAYVSPPPSQRIWWCRTSQRWYPDVGSCAAGWTR
jgi:hypothetical protein